MDEKWVEEFAETVDKLESLYFKVPSDNWISKEIKNCLDVLDAVYEDVKG